jgi:hypothetical protein
MSLNITYLKSFEKNSGANRHEDQINLRTARESVLFLPKKDVEIGDEGGHLSYKGNSTSTVHPGTF